METLTDNFSENNVKDVFRRLENIFRKPIIGSDFTEEEL